MLATCCQGLGPLAGYLQLVISTAAPDLCALLVAGAVFYFLGSAMQVKKIRKSDGRSQGCSAECTCRGGKCVCVCVCEALGITGNPLVNHLHF